MFKKSALLKYIGITIGVAVTIILVTKHPVLIGIEIIGAAIYFAGKKIK